MALDVLWIIHDGLNAALFDVTDKLANRVVNTLRRTKVFASKLGSIGCSAFT